ncbi:MAG: CoA transferase [Acidimicrobiales bacterium]|nr:CoA transferase [Acidimicrobiales bacterium]
MAGPLQGITVVEVAGELSAYTGKLLADLGATVTLIEPTAGSPLRWYEPFAGDQPDPDRSLWWWHYQAGKASVAADLDTADGAAKARALFAGADVVVESAGPGVLDALGLGAAAARAARPELIWVSITSHGAQDPRSAQPSTDLTLLAEGGPVWSCGYDDHTIPPVRGGGGQAGHTAGHYATMSLLAALLSRQLTGRGQVIDVNAYAAANVTTEMASYGYLAARSTVQRQTGRHASPRPTQPTQVICADGAYVNTGPPRHGKDFGELAGWLEQLGLEDEFDEMGVLRLGLELEHISMAQMEEHDLVGEIFAAGRAAMFFLAERLTAYELFLGLQQRGMPAGIIYSPEEVAADPHFEARHWARSVEHPELGRTVRYTGLPVTFPATPAGPLRPAPKLAERA